MSKPIVEQLEAVQAEYLKYSAAKQDPSDLFARPSPTPMRFTPEQPEPVFFVSSMEMASENDNRFADAMFKYILHNYGTEGQDILTPKEINLLPHYIDAHLLKLDQNFSDPEDKFHKILGLVREASEKCLKQKFEFKRN